jgi:hypothetical protein
VSSPTSDAPRAKRAARAPTEFRDGCASVARRGTPAGAGPPGPPGRASQNALALCYFTTSLFDAALTCVLPAASVANTENL